MIQARTISLGLIAAAALAGCNTTEPLLDESVSQGLVVRSVTVDVSALQKGITGRESDKTPAQVKADVEQALRATLLGPDARRGNAEVLVQITSVRLVSPGQKFALGSLGGASAITGVITVTGAGSGSVLLAPTEVSASSEELRLGGVIGALTTPSVEKDYADTVAGFANNVKTRLLGGNE